jgi:hypothetical protein
VPSPGAFASMSPPKTQWSDVVTRPGVMITGGYLKGVQAMETKDVQDIDEHGQMMKYTFVKLNKGQYWLYKSVAGAEASRRDLAELTLLDDIEKAVRAAALTSSDDSQDARPAQPPPKKYKSRRARDLITRVTMPRHPPNCGVQCVDTVEVRVYQDGRTGKGQWIDLESIPWAIAYLRHEREHAGCVPHDTAVADEPITGVSISWNWDSETWTATISDTLRRTHRSLPRDITTSPRDLTPEKWAQSAHLHDMTVDFDAVDPRQRREATRCYLIDYIKTELSK